MDNLLRVESTFSSRLWFFFSSPNLIKIHGLWSDKFSSFLQDIFPSSGKTTNQIIKNSWANCEKLYFFFAALKLIHSLFAWGAFQEKNEREAIIFFPKVLLDAEHNDEKQCRSSRIYRWICDSIERWEEKRRIISKITFRQISDFSYPNSFSRTKVCSKICRHKREAREKTAIN